MPQNKKKQIKTIAIAVLIIILIFYLLIKFACTCIMLYKIRKIFKIIAIIVSFIAAFIYYIYSKNETIDKIRNAVIICLIIRMLFVFIDDFIFNTYQEKCSIPIKWNRTEQHSNDQIDK